MNRRHRRATAGRAHDGAGRGATLTVRPAPAVHPAAMSYELDCPCSRTTAMLIPAEGEPPLTPAALLGILLVRRAAAGAGCACTDRLAARYGATVPDTLRWVLLAGEDEEGGA